MLDLRLGLIPSQSVVWCSKYMRVSKLWQCEHIEHGSAFKHVSTQRTVDM